MTIGEAIAYIDRIKPNGYTQGDKVMWLSRLDGRVKDEIIDTHEGAIAVVFDGYTDATPTTTELLVPEPYDSIYPLWLEAQIDYANGEIVRYNNAITTFSSEYQAYERFYHRTHDPIGTQIKFF